MNFQHFLPVVNGIPLFQRCLNSASALWPYTCVIDNCPEKILLEGHKIIIYRPVQPLYMYQTMNLMVHLAHGRKLFSFQHADTELLAGQGEQWLEQLARPRIGWGALLTDYDRLSAYNMDCIADIGAWDANFVTYWGDVDWFYRARVAGWELVETGIKPLHHGEENTRHGNPARAAMHGPLWAAQEAYYCWKWGGTIGQERFTVPRS